MLFKAFSQTLIWPWYSMIGAGISLLILVKYLILFFACVLLRFFILLYVSYQRHLWFSFRQLFWYKEKTGAAFRKIWICFRNSSRGSSVVLFQSNLELISSNSYISQTFLEQRKNECWADQEEECWTSQIEINLNMIPVLFYCRFVRWIGLHQNHCITFYYI